MSVDANAWCTLDQVRAQLHISISDADCNSLLTHLINVGYKRLEKYIGRQAKAKEYTEYISGDDSGKLVLTYWPVISVTSVHVDELREFGSDTLVDPANYYIDFDPDSSIGTIEIFKYDGSNPSWFTSGIRNVKVIYSAGWNSVPADLVQSLIAFVSWHFRRSGTEATRQQSIGGFSKSYEDDDLPPHIRSWLAPYKSRAV